MQHRLHFSCRRKINFMFICFLFWCVNSYFVRRQKIVINNNKYVINEIRYCTELTVPEMYRYFHLLTTERTANLAEYQLPPLPCTDYLSGYLCDTYLTHRLPSWPYDRPATSHRLPSWSVARTVHLHRSNYKYVIPSCYRCYTNICRRSAVHLQLLWDKNRVWVSTVLHTLSRLTTT